MSFNIEEDESDAIEVHTSRSVLDSEDDNVAQISFSWLNAGLLLIFGISSWVAINGLWMELPILVNVLPEGWILPAYLSVIIQIANVGPLVYVFLTRIGHSLGRNWRSNRCLRLIQPPERLANYTILIVGLIASILLTKFWDAVVVMPGLPANAVPGGSGTQEALYGHSLGLFVLTFALGMIDCMSSVTFIAYLANMPAVYAGALMFGETSSGLLPSLYALAQGVNTEPSCVPYTNENGTTEYHPVYAPPKFGVSTFMGLVGITTGLSLLAFILLDCLPMGLGRSVTLAYQRHHSLPTESKRGEKATDLVSTSTGDGGEARAADARVMNERLLLWVCFLLSGYSSCLTNGLLPSLQSFSTAAYSIHTFHLAVTLSGLAAPIVALIVTAIYGYDQVGLWMRRILCCCFRRSLPEFSDFNNGNDRENSSQQTPMSSIGGLRLVLILVLLCVVGSFFAGYIIFLAASSPSPPKLGGFGQVFSVLAWILMTTAFSIQRTWITLHLVKNGTQRNLRSLGITSQIGAALGALISFLLTAQLNVFVSKAPCT